MRLTAAIPHRIRLGKLGEAYAAAFLEQLGYCLVAANVTIPVGRNMRGAVVTAELDLVGYDGETLCFIEVKTRASDAFATPEANIDLRKRRQIVRAARAYRHMLSLVGEPHRYDAVTVMLADFEAVPEIQLIRNFWTEDSLRKRRWTEHYYD